MAALRRIFGRKIARWGIKQQQTIFRVENIFLQRATANKLLLMYSPCKLSFLKIIPFLEVVKHGGKTRIYVNIPGSIGM